MDTEDSLIKQFLALLDRVSYADFELSLFVVLDSLQARGQ